MHLETLQMMIGSLVALPLCAALLLAWSGSWQKRPTEALISGLTSTILWFSLGFALLLGMGFVSGEGHAEFFRYDPIAAVFTIVTAFVTALTASFTKRYLHADPGFLRFHCFLLTLASGSFLAFTTTENLALIAGWECVGISSFLLIAYFYKRARPRDHAVLVFGSYRFGDAALMIACVLAPVASADFAKMDGVNTNFFVCMILVAAACKSAQWPFSFWLPRAMEGPTPSSAVFYGGVSVHLGCFLLLRSEPIWTSQEWAHVAIVVVGLISFVHGWLAGRTSNDIKTKLAHSTISHIGLVFIEIGFGWPTLALMHVAAHALVRTPQMLLASSALAEHLHEVRSGTTVIRTDGWEEKLPAAMGWRIYRYGLMRGNLESWVQLLVVRPFGSIVAVCKSIETTLECALGLHTSKKKMIPTIDPPIGGLKLHLDMKQGHDDSRSKGNQAEGKSI